MKDMKRGLIVRRKWFLIAMAALIAVILLIALLPLRAHAITIYGNSNGYTTVGVVIATRINVRTDRKTTAPQVGSLKNGDEVAILSQYNGWYEISWGDGVAYVRDRFVMMNPMYVTTKQTVTLWATPNSKLAVGEKPKGTTFLVLEESDNYYVVQAQSNSAGVAYVRKSECDSYAQSNQDYYEPQISSDRAVVTANTLGVRASPNDEEPCIGYLHANDVVVKIGYPDNGFQAIQYPYMGQTVVAYVHDWYLMDIIE